MLETVERLITFGVASPPLGVLSKLLVLLGVRLPVAALFGALLGVLFGVSKRPPAAALSIAD